MLSNVAGLPEPASVPHCVLISLTNKFLTTCPEYDTEDSPSENLLLKTYSDGVCSAVTSP